MKMFCLRFFFALIVIPWTAFGQTAIEIIAKGKGLHFHHHLIKPQGKVHGILLLLPGLGEKPGTVLQKTNLPTLAAENGFLTIIPDLGKNLIADDDINLRLSELVHIYFAKYALNELTLIVGGFSRGGAISLRYAEHLIASISPIKLKGAFAIDPALDLRRLYFSAINKIQYDCSDLIKKEGVYTKRVLEKELGGTPEKHPAKYVKYSIYSAQSDSGGNAKYLKSLPVRLYSEPDLAYVREAYCSKLQEVDINSFDLERLNTLLRNLANTQCEYITTTGRGFHSWNILDSKNCVEWILQISK